MVSGGSFLQGESPVSDNLTLFLVQVVVVLAVSRLIAVPLRWLRQPVVISEVIGGILLGPTALSRWPGFKATVFPEESLPRLKLIADVGLVLFLFLVGLEIDLVKLAPTFKRSSIISLSGIILPFGIGVSVSKLIYDTMADTSKVSFTTFLVFCGIAMSITAFPILARILTERKLMRTVVGQTSLAAAAADDAIAWCLLVLVVALIKNPSNPILALYVFLTVLAWGLFLWFGVRPVLVYLVRKTDTSDDESISPSAVLATFVGVCVSGWLTQAVGGDAIFGGFLMGVITPHERGFAIKVAEKMEDLVSILFLPLYFAYTGLNFSIDSVNDAYSWGVALLVLVVACCGKIVGCMLTSRMSGLPWRESLAVGVLMNTKGLVELIVLNLGLQANVITTQVYTIFVIMALLTTFMTVPIISIVYPMSLYIGVDKKEDGRNSDGGSVDGDGDNAGSGVGKAQGHGSGNVDNESSSMTLPVPVDGKDKGTGMLTPTKSSALGRLYRDNLRLLVCLPGMKSVPSMMNMTQMIADSVNSTTTGLSAMGAAGTTSTINQGTDTSNARRTLSVYAMRLVALRNRISNVMMASEDAETLRLDPVANVFRTFGQLNKMRVRTLLSVAEPHDVADNIVDAVNACGVDLVVYPVDLTGDGRSSSNGSGSNSNSGSTHSREVKHGPLSARGGVASVLAMELLHRSPCSVVVFADRGFGVSDVDDFCGEVVTGKGTDADTVAMGPSAHTRRESTKAAFFGMDQRILLVFVGGPDDREAALVARWLCNSATQGRGVTLTVLVVSPAVVQVSFDPESLVLDDAVLELLSRVPGVEMIRIDEGALAHVVSGTGTNTGDVAATVTMVTTGSTTRKDAVIYGRVLESILVHAQTYGSRDMIVVGKGVYDGVTVVGGSAGNAASGVDSHGEGGTAAATTSSVTVRSLQAFIAAAMGPATQATAAQSQAAQAHAMAGKEDGSGASEIGRETLRVWLDTVAVASFAVVKRSGGGRGRMGSQRAVSRSNA